jgi:hypothetical protein
MEIGFKSLKDILDVVVIPLTLAVLATLFPAIKNWHNRRRFKKLILRELQEVGPFPDPNAEQWKHYLQQLSLYFKDRRLREVSKKWDTTNIGIQKRIISLYSK